MGSVRWAGKGINTIGSITMIMTKTKKTNALAVQMHLLRKTYENTQTREREYARETTDAGTHRARCFSARSRDSGISHACVICRTQEALAQASVAFGETLPSPVGDGHADALEPWVVACRLRHAGQLDLACRGAAGGYSPAVGNRETAAAQGI